MSVSLRIVLILLAISLLALAVTGSPLYSRLCYLWGGLLLVSWVWSRLSLGGVQIERTARTRRSEVGHIFEERFHVQNNGRTPRLWVEVRDESPLPGSQGSRVLTMLGKRQGSSYRARTRLVQRGVFALGPTVLASGDPFGLFPVSRTLPHEASLLVYPMMFAVRSFPNPAGLLPGGEALRQRTHHVTPNAAGVREYAPGDPLNRIHWVSTARRNRFMVKEFELDPLAEVWILVDAGRAVRAELPYTPPVNAADALWHPTLKLELSPSTEEYAASIAASLGRYYLQRGRAVGLVSHGSALNVLPPDRGGRQLGKILEAMALLRCDGAVPLLALVSGQARSLPRGSTVVLITSSTDPDVALAVDYLLRRGLRPVVVLLHADTFGGPEGAAALADKIRSLNAPVCEVICGADLETVLNATHS